MARIRAIKKEAGRVVVLWTPRKGGRAPASAIWEVTVSLGKDSRGRYRQRTERVRGTYTNAKEKAASMETAIGKGSAVDDPGRTPGQALELYIRYTEDVKGRASKTIIGYEGLARTINERIGSVQLRRLTADHLDSYYTWLTNVRGLSGRTVHHHHMLIKTSW